MFKPIHFKPAAELLARCLTGDAPADKQMETFFRAHREMGVRDRGAVAEAVYACLRERRTLEAIAGDAAAAADLLAAWLLSRGRSARALGELGFKGDASGLAERARSLDLAQLPLAVRTNLADWLAGRLVDLLGEAQTLDLAEALNRPAPVDLRVNTFKAKREAVQARLAAEGFPCEPTPFSPVGLRRADRAPLFNSSAFKEGLFEVQDEGSQLISLLLEPRRRETVVDFCAGAGGKTLHIGAAMANTGTVYAFEVLEHRLERLKPRLKRSGLQNVRAVAIKHERDDRVRRLAGKADRVLVDAPCSGTGTLRRNPDIKWRPVDLAALAATQRAILASAATLLKPGGRLVYATCSLLTEENEAVVAEFLADHPEFTQIPVAEVFERRGILLSMEGLAMRLYPHRHNTDGFFAAILERR